jgi:hypothetical protein
MERMIPITITRRAPRRPPYRGQIITTPVPEPRQPRLVLEFPALPPAVEAALADEIRALVARTVQAQGNPQSGGFANGEPPRPAATDATAGK